ncbi:MAG: FG-GAP-like repeat-containing protein, partial [Cytophagales bacterium]
QMPIRGFQSSVDPRPNIGLGTIAEVDEILIDWPSGRQTILKKIRTDSIIKISEADFLSFEGSSSMETQTQGKFRFYDVSNDIKFTYKHAENQFVDFDRDRLIFHMVSTEGPKLSVADVNKDGLDDFYIGGAKDQPGALIIQQPKNGFVTSTQKAFEIDKVSEDLGSVFFDADNDGDIVIYVCSGSSEFSTSSSALFDRLYLNDGKGNYKNSNQALPAGKFESSSCVKANDYDRDGDMDLFVGIRLEPFRYGMPMNGYILNNNGKGIFSVGHTLKGIGMITDAEWADIDGDKDFDLIVVGEWMSAKIYLNENGKFIEATENAKLLSTTSGWWNTIEAADLDKDGDID